MIVECQACETRFQLDESRIPSDGIRVRCSNCKEAFFLPHPSATKEDGAAETAAVAEASFDFSAGSAAGEDADEDWEFNLDDDGQAAEDPASAANGSAAPEAESPAVAAPSAEDDAADSAATEFSEAPSSAARDEIVFEEEGDVEDSSGLDLATEETPAAVQPPAEPSPSESLARSMAEELEAQPDAEIYQDAKSKHGDGREAASEIGEPEDWDFLGEERSRSEAGEAAVSAAADGLENPFEEPASAAAPIGRIQTVKMRGSMIGAALEADDFEPELDSEATRVGALRAGVPAGLRAGGAALGWALSLALVAVLLQRSLWPALTVGPFAGYASTPLATTLSVGAAGASYQAQDVHTSWVRTASGEDLLVVRGSLVGAPRGAAVHVQLLDASGRSLDQPEVRAGIPLQDAQLREGPSAGLAGLQAHAMASRGRHATSSQQGFAAYLRGVPAQAARVRLTPDASAEVPYFAAAAPSSEAAAEGIDALAVEPATPEPSEALRLAAEAAVPAASETLVKAAAETPLVTVVGAAAEVNTALPTAAAPAPANGDAVPAAPAPSEARSPTSRP